VRPVRENESVSKTYDRLRAIIDNGGTMTTTEMARKFNISDRAARWWVHLAIDKGMLVRQWVGRMVLYSVSKNIRM
jgi:predicted transcriptional regulator